jgi:peptidoglycan/xylan/chitin deacetylase (PgdA/CDA1 family)
MRRRRFLGLLGAGAVGGAATRLVRPGSRDVPRTAEPQPIDEYVERPTSGQQRIVWSVDTDIPAGALTFDDGPDLDFTPQILDVLERYDVKATFFALGYNAVQHPNLLRRVAADGHEIGSHGNRHLNLAETSPAETRGEIELGTRMVEEEAGVPVRVFRPPYGRMDEASLRLLALRGNDMVVWSINRGKLAWREPHRIASHVVGSLEPGGIIGLHDGIGRGTFNRGSEGAARLRRRREVEIEALPGILRGARARGIQLTSVSKLMAAARSDRRQA